MRTAVLLALALAPLAASAQVEPGNWELTATTRMAGMAEPVGPISQTRCITAEDARDPSRVLGTGAGCEFSNRRDIGNAYSFDIRCGGALPMRGSGQVRYSAHAFEGELDLTVDAQAPGGAPFNMRSQMSGRWLGPC